MEGMSERQYAARVGLSRGAIQKAKAAGRLVMLLDGIDAELATPGARRRRTRPRPERPAPKLKPVPEAAVAAVGDTLREQGLAVRRSAAARPSCRPRPRMKC